MNILMVPVSSKNRTHLTPFRRDAIIVITCMCANGLLVLASQLANHSLGFPLDDAWIYQVYARNLAQTGQWAFVPGVPSSGATSILWTVLIVPAYVIGVDGPAWTLVLGLLLLIAAALGAARMLGDEPGWVSLAGGLGVGLEWHLVWASASGMETILFSALLVWFWAWLRRQKPAATSRIRDSLALGIWGGALTLSRPEGILAFGWGWLYWIAATADWRRRLVSGLSAGLALAVMLSPIFAFNFAASGTIWPNTLDAKQTEYAVYRNDPVVLRLFDQMSSGWIGAQLLLLPAIILDAWRRIRSHPHDWPSLLPWIWAISHWVLYALRLPVTYQHARYAMAVVPLMIVFGVYGLSRIVRPRAQVAPVRIASLVWIASFAAGLLAMLIGPGLSAYVQDVGYIDKEMVAAAKWVAANTSPDAVIAVHDIGALGYFAPRPIVDLAGLVSPAVIGFMHDDRQLTDYIIRNNASYLIVFPKWSPAYERLVSNPIFCKVWASDEEAGYFSRPDLSPLTIYSVGINEPCPGRR